VSCQSLAALAVGLELFHAVRAGSAFATVSPSFSFPCATSCRMIAAVNVFVMLPIRKLSAVVTAGEPRTALPNAVS
jgi:hypothetical protein